MMGETRQQEPRDFATEMADLEAETIKQIIDICDRAGLCQRTVGAAAMFAAHIVTCICDLERNDTDEQEELPWT